MEAFGKHESMFARSVVLMVQAGTAGGVLDVVADRVAEGIEDSSFPVPRTEPEGDEMARYWRALGRMVSSGVPLLDALQGV